MRAAAVEFRPVVGLGILQVMRRITDIDDFCMISPKHGSTLDGVDLLIVGALCQGDEASMLELLRTAGSVRGILYLGASGTMQGMITGQVVPLTSWLPETASTEVVEQTLREMVGVLRADGCANSLYADRKSYANALPPLASSAASVVLPMILPTGIARDKSLPEYMAEAIVLGLTQRQYDVLVLLSKGLPIKLISRRLHISAATVKSHAIQAYRRLGARNKTEAVFVARGRGASLRSVSTPEVEAA